MERTLRKHSSKKKIITCKECCRQMGDYIDGKLSVDEDILFVEHIRGCKECAEEFHNYYNFMTNLYFLNFGYSDRFPASEEQLLAETEEVLYRYTNSRKVMGWAAALLLLIILILVNIIVFQYLGGYAL